MKKFREHDMNLVREELKEMQEEKEKQEFDFSDTWRDLLTKRPLKRALYVALGLQIAQQFSGFCFLAIFRMLKNISSKMSYILLD